MLQKLIAVVGPTASGKTELGIELARRVGGEVVSVDSRQVYRGMDIGTAKTFGPWGIDLVDPNVDYSVADFKEYAEKKIEDILKRQHVPILVGGTGLWMSALIDNFDLTQTASDPALRAELEARPLCDLFARYALLDPLGSELIDRENKRRLVRALEVVLLTGKPFFAQQKKGKSKYDVLQIGLSVDRAVLNERINQRVDQMIASGFVDEVRALYERYGCDIDAMTGIGYRQICAFFSGLSSLDDEKVSLGDVSEEIKRVTRQYAKRQMTWFKRDRRIHWVTEIQQVFSVIDAFLKK